MTAPRPPRKKRRPQKVVSDPVRANEILNEMVEGQAQIRRLLERRLELAAEASSLGP